MGERPTQIVICLIFPVTPLLLRQYGQLPQGPRSGGTPVSPGFTLCQLSLVNCLIAKSLPLAKTTVVHPKIHRRREALFSHIEIVRFK